MKNKIPIFPILILILCCLYMFYICSYREYLLYGNIPVGKKLEELEQRILKLEQENVLRAILD